MGIVRGRVVLSPADPALAGTRFLIVEVITAERLGRIGPDEGTAGTASGRGTGRQPRVAPERSGTPRTLIVADRLNPARGQIIGFVEGREAANPYGRHGAPVDATSSLIVDCVEYRPLSPEP